MGIVSFRTSSTNPGRSANFIAFIPRSEMARFIDFVKFNGTVDGSRRSAEFIQQRNQMPWHQNAQEERALLHFVEEQLQVTIDKNSSV
jgi:hypothetical protein